MSARVDIAFGDAAAGLHGLIRNGEGALLHADGRTESFGAAVVDGDHVSVPGAVELTLEPAGEPTTFGDGTTHTLCRAQGTVLGEEVELLATRVEGAAGARDLAARSDDGLVVALRAQRPRRARNHGDERVEAFVAHGTDAPWTPVADPLLSTTFDSAHAVLRAGLELWEHEEAPLAVRLGAETVAHGELGSSQVALCVFRHEGSHGSGHYVLDGA